MAKAQACSVNPFITPGRSLAEVDQAQRQAERQARELGHKGLSAAAIAERTSLGIKAVEAMLGDGLPDSRVVGLQRLPTMIRWAIAQLVRAGLRVRLGTHDVIFVEGHRHDPDQVLHRAVALFQRCGRHGS